MKNYFSKHSIVTVWSACVLTACTGPQEETTYEQNTPSTVTLTEAQYKNAGVVTGSTESRNLNGIIKVSGMLDVPPQNLVTVSFPYAGIVKETKLLQGMKVKKGEVLAILEHPDLIQLQQDYLDNKSKLDFLKLELERQQELQKENINAVKTLQKVQSDYESMKAIVNGLRQKLSLINISPELIQKEGIQKRVRVLSPIDGYITQLNINVGMLISPNEVLCKIVDIRHLHVELTVFEKDIMKLKPGQKVEVEAGKERRMASVYLIGKEIAADRTVRVHCHLDKEDQSLLPGMYITAYVETDNRRVSALPEEAVVEQNGKHYVFISKGKNKEGYLFEQKEVKTGITENHYTEIDSSLPSDSIVLQGAYDLISKMNLSEEEE